MTGIDTAGMLRQMNITHIALSIVRSPIFADAILASAILLWLLQILKKESK